MTINIIMKERNITKYRLSKDSNIPYSTVNDICNGKAQLEKCSAETIYKLSKALDISMESLLESCFETRCDFEIYKSNVCHRVKELGDAEFIIETLTRDDIRKYYQKRWHPECLYLLAMLDYISRVNGIPLCTKYDDLRKCKLTTTIYPSSIIASYMVTKNEEIKIQAYREAIPEFKRFNIIESEIRNVI